MRIVREDEKFAAFGDISNGGVFVNIEDNDVYMKIPKVYEIETNGAGQESRWSYNAICLSDGQPYLYVDSDMVKPCGNAYLTVK